MQRFGHVGRRTGFTCVMLGLLAALVMSRRFVPDTQARELFNPDSYMRLTRLRDMLDSGFVLFGVAHDGSGHGTVLAWSHLIDSLLCVLALPFSLFLDPHTSLYAAALIFGPLNIAALSFAVIWAAAPYAEHKWLWLGAILPALSPGILYYGIPGVVHHHVAVAIVAVAAWGWAARIITGRAPRGAGIALGAWAGLGIWLTPETVPLTMMAFGALGVAWMLSPSRSDIAREIGLSGLSSALVTLLALIVDPPGSGISSPDIDRLSILFGGLSLAVAATGMGVWIASAKFASRSARIGVACAIGCICCGFWAVLFRDPILHSNMALDEAGWSAFYGHIAEMMPVVGAFHQLQFLLTGTWALLFAVSLAVRRRLLLLAYVALCLAGLVAIGWTHVRFSAYPEAAGAIALPVALTLMSTATIRWHQIARSFTRLAIILLFIQVPFLGQMPDLITGARATPPLMVPACRAVDAIGMLASHPGAVVLADVNDTPELLYKTQVRTVGSLYHRNVSAFLRLRAAWRVPRTQTVPPEIDAAEIDLVLGCRGPARSPLVEELTTSTLSDQVRAGNPPPWLVQIDENPASGHVLYEVVRYRGTASLAAVTR